MAEPPINPTPVGPLDKTSCPNCGAEVTARPHQRDDQGRAFLCPNCNTLFGVVPGIPEPVEERD
ncbi:MAG: transposase [Actinomycetota bacterium]|nr:transposase [Actinomycetota bacterium]